MATEAELAHTAGTCINEHGGALGMPQLCAEWWPNQIFWLLVTLVVIYLVLSKIALPRISAVLADRKGTITNDLAAAEELKQKAVAAEKAYNDALANAQRAVYLLSIRHHRQLSFDFASLWPGAGHEDVYWREPPSRSPATAPAAPIFRALERHMNDLVSLRDALRIFATDRDWDQFHSLLAIRTRTRLTSRCRSA